MSSQHSYGDDPNTRDAETCRPTRVSRLALPPAPPSSATQLRLRSEHANFTGAMLQIFQRYAVEVRAFLRARTSSRASMEEVFSVFSEDVWKGLPHYRSQGHPRGWVYAVARNALARHVRFKQRWRHRHVALDLDELEPEMRRSISAQLGNIAQLEPLLERLDEADRRLLEQRLVLSRPWREIAIESASARGDATQAEIAKESARLRKRYQLLLQSLRARAAIRCARYSRGE